VHIKKVKNFVRKYFYALVNEFNNRDYQDVILNLSVEEKVLIYKYTYDGYESLNEEIRDNKLSDFNEEYKNLLIKTLDKLPDFIGIVYRNVNLTKNELEVYENSLKNNVPIKEFAFVSTTKSKLIANQFGGDTFFIIISRSGKSVEEISYFGTGHPLNEKEVLFKCYTKFQVLEVTKLDTKTLIIMEEI